MLKPALDQKGLRLEDQLSDILHNNLKLLKPALDQKGLRLIFSPMYLSHSFIFVETCPGSKGIATWLE